MMIDAHQHFWQIARGDYGWLTPELAPIYRDFGPADLAPILARHGIARSILVQAAPTVAETRYMLAIAATTPSVAGVVGWVDFTTPDAPAAIAELARDPLLVGLRPMVHDIDDDDWLLRDDLRPAIAAMAARGLVFDALVRPRHLPRLVRFIERHPELAIVVDHGAKPEIAAARIEPWLSDMRAIAARPAVMCKLSGLVTEAAHGWRPADVRPCIDHLLALFGPARLVWGSDWPVVDLAGGYDGWWGLTQEALADCSAADRAQILGANAECLYLSRGRGRT
jgi:L-fuconolactonase